MLAGIVRAAFLGLIVRVKKTAFIVEDNIVRRAVGLFFCHKLSNFKRKKRVALKCAICPLRIAPKPERAHLADAVTACAGYCKSLQGLRLRGG